MRRLPGREGPEGGWEGAGWRRGCRDGRGRERKGLSKHFNAARATPGNPASKLIII